MFKNNGNEFKKNGLICFNIIIFFIVFFCFISGFVFLFSYKKPDNLKETTGIIAKVKQYDKQWYDYFGGVTGSYFNVTFEDGTYFEATGICYDNINRELFELVKIGEEIKITYNSSFTKPNRIYSIEYNGVNYLSLDDVLTCYENEAKSARIQGAIMICVSVAGCVVLFLVNYRHRKKSGRG